MAPLTEAATKATDAEAAYQAYTAQCRKVIDAINTSLTTTTSATGLSVLTGAELFVMTMSKKDIWQAVCDNVKGAAKSTDAIARHVAGLRVYFSVGYDRNLVKKKSKIDKRMSREGHLTQRGVQESPDMLKLASHSPGQVTAFTMQHDIKARANGTVTTITVVAQYAYQTRRGASGENELVYAEIPTSYP